MKPKTKPRPQAQIARRMLEARQRRKLSQVQVAELSGISGGSCAISHWESGRRTPSLENFTKLCIALRISPAITLIDKG